MFVDRSLYFLLGINLEKEMLTGRLEKFNI